MKRRKHILEPEDKFGVLKYNRVSIKAIKCSNGQYGLWERGGSNDYRGDAVIIASSTGHKALLLELAPKGKRYNENHALCQVSLDSYVIFAFHYHGIFRIRIFCVDGMQDGMVDLIKVNEFSAGRWDKYVSDHLLNAVNAAKEKSRCYHCQKVFFAAHYLRGKDITPPIDIKWVYRRASNYAIWECGGWHDNQGKATVVANSCGNAPEVAERGYEPNGNHALCVVANGFYILRCIQTQLTKIEIYQIDDITDDDEFFELVNVFDGKNWRNGKPEDFLKRAIDAVKKKALDENCTRAYFARS